MLKAVIIDYGMGNLDSVARAVEECGREAVITNRPGELKEANYIIIPGVGSFADAMRNIRSLGMDKAIKEEVVGKGIPLLGICLGMQLLAEKGLEGGETGGLGLIEGDVTRLKPDNKNIKIPHVGWNEVLFDKPCALFDGIPSGKDFYFVHSYHFVCKHKEDIMARTPYCGDFASAIKRKNISGVQFHPEKSLRLGIKMLHNFLYSQPDD